MVREHIGRRSIAFGSNDNYTPKHPSGGHFPPAPLNDRSPQATITLPKGGGAVKGISEQFKANPVTGTSTLSIPLPVSSARGFQPELNLGYDSGAGNSPFGLGWTLTAAAISRKTEKGLPRYLDRDDSDIYMLDGVEDLVPLLEAHGESWQERGGARQLAGETWAVKSYRPRIDGAFTRIERWRHPVTNVIWWRTTSAANVTRVFGYRASARIADPENPARIFKWLIDCAYDDKGHYTQYVYKTEDMAGVDHRLAYERHRQGHPVAQTYLKRVWYGIKQPYHQLYPQVPEVLDKPFSANDFHFQTVFDFGEHTASEPNPEENLSWGVRPDPFSDYRAGFEIRTYRRCQRILLFHQFAGHLPTASEPVRQLALGYDDTNATFSLLTTIVSTGFTRDGSGALQSKSLPAITFNYQAHPWDSEIKTIDSDSLTHLPGGVDGRQYQWVDLLREGLSGVLSEQADGLYYKRNLGRAAFADARQVAPAPSVHGLARGDLQLQDLEGDGAIALVSTTGPARGFFQSLDGEKWDDFIPFDQMPGIDFKDPSLRLIDLNGDGRPDLLVSEERAFRWYPSQGRKGYGPAQMAETALSEEEGPAIVFTNPSESIVLADMTGDGLTDIVCIRNSSIVYWPNLGYGRFGAKVTMGDAPRFDHPDQFDPGRVRLADLDGSGTADLIYLGKDELCFWLNLGGNRWHHPFQTINPFPDVDDLSDVSVIDLLGAGTACVVWSSPLPTPVNRSIRYVDLMAGTKPYLLATYENGMGREVRLGYTTSTAFYLEDKQNGEPWITRLHFPVHCLSSVETIDHITNARFVSTYRYHHGYYDHAEREFRGFGRVDQTDTEDYAHFVNGDSANVVDRVLHQSPVLTKTWFHTGVYMDNNHVLAQYRQEYFTASAIADLQLEEPALPTGLTAAEWREALRACKGMALRSEVYGLDGTTDESIPYAITQNSCEIRRLQPRADNRHAVFQVIDSQSLTLQLDRRPEDPRVSHQLTLQTDAYGHPLVSATVGYPRRISDPDVPEAVRAEQAKTHIVITHIDYTNDVYGPLAQGIGTELSDSPYRLPVPWKTATYALSGLNSSADALYRQDAILSAFNDADGIGYEQTSETGLVKRLLSCSEIRFANDVLDGPRDAGVPHPLGISWQTYRLAFTPSLMESIYGGKVDPAIFDGGYVDLNGDGNWWAPSGTPIFGPDAARRFYLPTGEHDCLGNPSWIDLDDYLLLPVRSRDARQNETLAVNDYRTLSPRFVRDPNHNWHAVAVDALGMVVKSAVMGKVAGLTDGQAPAPDAACEGDNLAYPSTELNYGFYDPSTHQPGFAYTRTYVNHHAVDPGENRADYLQQYEYADGAGQVIMVKKQAEPGLAKYRNDDGTTETVDTGDAVRWIGNGRTVLNNKGNPVKQYEPYFSVTPSYEDDPALVEIGVTPILFYDAAGRMDGKLYPNHTYEKVVFDPWQQTSWDVSDTLVIVKADGTRESNPAADPDVGHYFTGLDSSEYLPSWHAARIDGALGMAQQRAAEKSEAHVDTPARVFTDALGRTIHALADNGASGKVSTRTVLDIEGNTLAVVDDRDNTVMHYRYAMLPPTDEKSPKPAVYQNSMDGGERWTLFNALGQPMRSWDSRGHGFENRYDALSRPTQTNVTENGSRKTIVLTRYRDSDGPDADAWRRDNLIGTAHKAYDQAGLIEILSLDFKGNLLHARRTLAVEYKTTIDWSVDDPQVLLQSETFETRAEYDALNRVTRSLSPHNPTIPASETWLTYNASGALDKVDAAVRGGHRQPYVVDMEYDARGKRRQITYGNGIVTDYDYEPDTFRLKRLLTRRHSGDFLQDLNYTYDPAGNITEIRDNTQQTLYFQNAVVEPHSQYTYDPLYRLVAATGREHAGQNRSPSSFNGWLPEAHPNDGGAMRSYTQTYTYDGVGNILQMAHRAGGGGWSRHYQYAGENNRLLATTLGDPSMPFDETYDYNAHGSMTRMPHLQQMDWDVAEQLCHVDLSGGGQAWYVYDADGQRTRKIIETNGSLVKERIYFGGWEIYRERVGDRLDLERETLHVMDDQRRIALIDTQIVKDSIPASTISPVVRYQMGNHLGSSSLEINDKGRIISYEEFHPFGTTAYFAGEGVVEENGKRFRYTGKERDEESGFSYHQARYLLGWLGRWTSIDPFGIKDGPNVYAYAHDNPACRIDLNGRDSFNAGNILAEFQDDFGDTFVAVQAKKGTWISATAKSLGLDETYSKEQGYGAYVEGVVYNEQWQIFENPDRLEVGEIFYVKIRSSNSRPMPIPPKPKQSRQQESWRKFFLRNAIDAVFVDKIEVAVHGGLGVEALEGAAGGELAIEYGLALSLITNPNSEDFLKIGANPLIQGNLGGKAGPGQTATLITPEAIGGVSITAAEYFGPSSEGGLESLPGWEGGAYLGAEAKIGAGAEGAIVGSATLPTADGMWVGAGVDLQGEGSATGGLTGEGGISGRKTFESIGVVDLMPQFLRSYHSEYIDWVNRGRNLPK
ncbi:insecticidal toxin complex protein, TcdB family [Desulfosarcina variabilis str. Montpellier]|uniref:SpvB/TcaC N-terminal domain-containing protein n=1 Tax=Desulfosarcina variabilis TaxID=2300 RepID=UPI003AFB67F6